MPSPTDEGSSALRLFSAFLGRGRQTAPDPRKHYARLQVEGQPGTFPALIEVGVDSVRLLNSWQGQQRESYLSHCLNGCYPCLTLVADKEQIFSSLSSMESEWVAIEAPDSQSNHSWDAISMSYTPGASFCLLIVTCG